MFVFLSAGSSSCVELNKIAEEELWNEATTNRMTMSGIARYSKLLASVPGLLRDRLTVYALWLCVGGEHLSIKYM